MLQFQLGPAFKMGVTKLALPFSPVAGKFSQSLIAGARQAVVGGIAGWGVALIAGAVLMTNVSHQKCCGVSAPPAVASAAVVKAAEPMAPKTETASVVATPIAPPAPVVAKSTQRVDMTPTASIAVDPAGKPKHKPHKKKPKDLDNHN